MKKIICVLLGIAMCLSMGCASAASQSFSFEYISFENGGITGLISKADNEQIMYVTITSHTLISGDAVQFRGRNSLSQIVTNPVTFRKGYNARMTTSYSTYCGAGTRIKLNGVCSAYSNAQGTDRVFNTRGQWTP